MDPCINKEIIEDLRKQVQRLETKNEVLESNVNAVKENIRDMKTSIKEISDKMDNGFKTIDHKTIAILTSEVLLLLGIIANFFIR
jgi:predicted  nucleic acid-binding Zn-ribbon protein